MIVTNSQLALSSQHTHLERREQHASLTLWRDRPAPPPARQPVATTAPGPAPESPAPHDSAPVFDSEAALDADPLLRVLRDLIEHVFGQRVELLEKIDVGKNPEALDPPPSKSGDSTPEQRQGWGLAYDFHAVHEIREETRFSAGGRVQTGDGREIAFSMSFSMEYAFREESSVRIRAGDARLKDPLVLRFDGTAAQLADGHFRFDLNRDGEAEALPQLAAGTVFLAFDRNSNGYIDDGSELFGPTTGEGFSELAAHDDDGNGWIDEADTVFSQLRLWAPQNDTQTSLLDAGVGALGLARIATPHGLRDTEGALQGQLRSTGVWLGEEGGSGLLQQIDLVA